MQTEYPIWTSLDDSEEYIVAVSSDKSVLNITINLLNLLYKTFHANGFLCPEYQEKW